MSHISCSLSLHIPIRIRICIRIIVQNHTRILFVSEKLRISADTYPRTSGVTTAASAAAAAQPMDETQ